MGCGPWTGRGHYFPFNDDPDAYSAAICTWRAAKVAPAADRSLHSYSFQGVRQMSTCRVLGQGHTALVTGASRGIGTLIAREIASQGGTAGANTIGLFRPDADGNADPTAPCGPAPPATHPSGEQGTHPPACKRKEGRNNGFVLAAGAALTGKAGRFLILDPLPNRLLYAEPLRRRLRVRFGGAWIAGSEDAVVLHEPDRYPVAYFPHGDITPDALQPSEYTTRHRDLGLTSWFTVAAGGQSTPRAAWQHTQLPAHASELRGTGRVRVAGHGRFLRGKTNGSSATPPTATIASTSARPAATSSSAAVTASSPTAPALWSCTSPASRPAGTSRAPTSTSRP